MRQATWSRAAASTHSKGSTQAKATGGPAVPVAALLRAATAICLTDPRLRQRMIDLARTEWR